MVELRAVTKDNLEEVLSLNIFPHQKAFVTSTACSLAQAYVYSETAFPFVVYADNTIVGFIMLGYYEDRKQYTLWKFLIDKEYQQNGYGKDALKQGIKYLIDKFNVKEVYTGVASENEVAKHLYSSIGFEETGLIEDNMIEMKCNVREFH